MIALLGAFCVALVFYGGGIFNSGDIVGGLSIASFGIVALGTLFAIVTSFNQHFARFDTREGLSLDQLHAFLSATTNLTGDTKVYVGDQGLNVAGSVFSCILDGRRTVVIERRAEPKTPAAPVYFP